MSTPASPLINQGWVDAPNPTDHWVDTPNPTDHGVMTTPKDGESHPLDQAKRFLDNWLVSHGPIGAVQGAGQTLMTDPRKTVGSMLDQNGALYKEAKDSLDKGDYGLAAMHFLNYALNGIPGLGYALDDAGNDFRKGDYVGGASKTAGLATTIALGAKTPQIVEGAANAVDNVKSGASNLLKADVSKDLINAYSPTDPRFNERAPGAAADIKKYAVDTNGNPVMITGNEHLASTSPTQVVTPALQANRVAMDAWHQPVQQAGITASPNNILRATQDSVKSMSDPAAKVRILDEAQGQINQQPLTADRLKELIEEKNGELKGFYSKDPAEQAAARQAGAASGKSQALLEAQSQALRDEYYNMLDPQNGGAGPREIQRRYGAIKMLQDEASAGGTRNKILGETGGSTASRFTQAGLNTLDLVGAPFREGGLSEGLNRILEPFRGETDPLIKRAFANAPDSAPLPQAPPIQQRYPQSFGTRQLTAGTTPPTTVLPSSGRVIITPQSSEEAIAQAMQRAVDTIPGANDVFTKNRQLGPSTFETNDQREMGPVRDSSSVTKVQAQQPFRVGFPPEAPKQIPTRDPNAPATNSARVRGDIPEQGAPQYSIMRRIGEDAAGRPTFEHVPAPTKPTTPELIPKGTVVNPQTGEIYYEHDTTPEPTEFQQGKPRNPTTGRLEGGTAVRPVMEKGKPVITTQQIEPANPTASAYTSPRMRALMDEEANRQYGVKYSDLRDGSTQKAFVDSLISKNLMRLNSLMQGKVQ